LVIATSSHIIKDVPLSNYDIPLCFVKLHIVLPLIFIGILNWECAVCPSGIMEIAITDVAVATTIRSIEHTLAIKALQRYVLLVLPGPSSKNTYHLLFTMIEYSSKPETSDI